MRRHPHKYERKSFSVPGFWRKLAKRANDFDNNLQTQEQHRCPMSMTSALRDPVVHTQALGIKWRPQSNAFKCSGNHQGSIRLPVSDSCVSLDLDSR